MDSLEERISGEIAMSDSPGTTMKKWREIFGISQVELAKYLKISASTISDYEGNRRSSPGVSVIRRFVNALVAMDEERGGSVARNLAKLKPQEEDTSMYLIHDFSAPISGVDFARQIDAKVVSNPNYLDDIKLFGYTLLDSLKVILEISPSEYPRLFGSTTDRAFIFNEVSTGRSPMVVVRVAPIKPKVVVIMNLDAVDKLAVKISQIEHVPLLTTKLTVEDIKLRLSNI
ncbi:MAG: helix-turn-helix domain-containing protein [Candidatus Micrarchaeaceae archaeon]